MNNNVERARRYVNSFGQTSCCCCFGATGPTETYKSVIL